MLIEDTLNIKVSSRGLKETTFLATALVGRLGLEGAKKVGK